MTEGANATGRENGMLDMVRKLLAKAEGTDNPTEADTYNDKAAELIARYGIDMALLNAARAEAEQEVVGDRVVRVPGPYAYEKSVLLFNVAQALSVHTVRRNTRLRSQGFDVHMFGFDSDLERVDLLFTSLLVQASLGVARVQSSHSWESAVTYRKSWIWGFTTAVRARLDAAENRAKEETGDAPGTDLVLADRKAIVDSRVREVYPKVKAGRSVRVSGSGYGDGQAAGSRADLGGARINRVSRRSIGQ